MNTKSVYQLDEEEYLVGQTIAFESPLEPGIFHIPRGCVDTDKELPEFKNFDDRIKWSGTDWTICNERIEREKEEELKKQEEERLKLEEIQKIKDEKKRQEELEEQKKLEEQERVKLEEQRRLEEEKRLKQEELQRLEELKKLEAESHLNELKQKKIQLLEELLKTKDELTIEYQQIQSQIAELK